MCQVAKTLCDNTNQPLSAQTVQNGIKEVGMKAVVKKKRPLLTKHHRRERMDYALSHKDWTIEGWKKIFGQMRQKLIVWGQMGGNGCGKGMERV